MAVILRDLFDGSGDLTSHTSDSGATWTLGPSDTTLPAPTATFPLSGGRVASAKPDALAYVVPSADVPASGAFELVTEFEGLVTGDGVGIRIILAPTIPAYPASPSLSTMFRFGLSWGPTSTNWTAFTEEMSGGTDVTDYDWPGWETGVAGSFSPTTVRLVFNEARTTLSIYINGNAVTPYNLVSPLTGSRDIAIGIVGYTASDFSIPSGFLRGTAVLTGSDIGTGIGSGGGAGANTASGFQVPVSFGSPVFLTRAGQAFGFESTSFGVPDASIGAASTPVDLLLSASGFRPTSFGVPAASDPAGTGTPVYASASGFATLAFGTATASAAFSGSASGFSQGLIGLPTASPLALTLAQGADLRARFGLPSLPTTTAYAASGFSLTQFGTPERIVPFVGAGFQAAAFGLPTLIQQQAGSAAGFTGTAFRLPQAARVFSAASASFPTQFGGASSRQVLLATSGSFRAQFGLPGTLRSTTAAAALFPQRFGTPRVTARFTATAAGFSQTAFGSPAAAPFFKTRSFLATTGFGRPHLER